MPILKSHRNAIPRIAILGLILESNRFAPVTTEDDFRRHGWFEGEDILRHAWAEQSHLAREVSAFVRLMHATGDWHPVPIAIAASGPWGPVDEAFFSRFCDQIVDGLREALETGPLDGVYIASHGAMVATEDLDPDGTLYERVRETVGDETPIIATLDLHANISDRMVDKTDVLIGYRTNPHVDQIERGEEAALTMRRILAGLADPTAALIRLPIVAPSVCLLTAQAPYGSLIDLGQRLQAERSGSILNVSVFGNFAFSDTPHNGLGIVVTARDDRREAEAVARLLATQAWENRADFVKDLTPMSDGIQIALTADREAVIFSESGDNPGGGGSGRTTDFLSALIESNAQAVLHGAFFEPELADDAHSAGLGSHFLARFNRLPGTEFDRPFEARAEVVGLSDGDVTGRLGLFRGRHLRLGKSAALRIGGVTAVVISARVQAADPVIFEQFGLNVGDFQTIIVKSRGHFRAGFAPWFAPQQVYEIDTPGLTAPVLSRFEWRDLPRPVFPLDPDTNWTMPKDL